MKPNISIILASSILLFVAACEEDDDQVDGGDPNGSTCSCKTPNNGQFSYCGTSFTRDVNWSRQAGRTCEETSGGTTLVCCPGTIQTSHNTVVDRYLGVPMIKRVSYSSPMALQGGSLALPTDQLPETISCSVECDKASSPFCAKVSGQQRHALRDAISLVTTSVTDGSDLVLKSALMEAAGVGADYCDRDNLVLSSNLVSNTGAPCALRTELEAGGVSLQSVSLTMPEKITAQWTTPDGETPFFDFPNSLEAPQVMFDGYLQQDFGGLIRRVNVGENGVSIRTGNGCIGL